MSTNHNKQSNAIVLKFENHKTPEFKEVRGKDWVYYGENNLYPDYLIDLYLRSAKHNAIINGKVNYIYGGGLDVSSVTANKEQQAIANDFFKNVLDPDNLRRWILDFELFNAFATEVIWNKAGKKYDLNYIPLSKIRTNKDESKYYYSNDWTAQNQTEEKTGFKEFNPFNAEKPGGSQLYVFKLLSPIKCKEQNVYSVPEYIGANASIETDIEISNYHLNNIKTGFSVGTIINFNNGVPEQAAQDEIEKRIKKKFQGTDKAGSVLLTFNNSSDKAPTITSFAPSDLDKQFIEIGKRVEQDIFTGHKITSPMLFGVKTEGQLGGRSEMVDAFELFQNSYIAVRQAFLEQVFNGFANLMGIVNKVEFKKVAPIKSNLPDAIIQKAYDSLTIDELREIVGLPPMAKTAPVAMAAEKKKLNLKDKGVGADGYEILFEREFNGQADEDCIEEFNKIERFKSELTANERAIVDLLGKDPLMPSEGISKILKISVDEVNSTITSLNDRGYLTNSNEPTKVGEKVVNKDGAKTVDIEVKYRYDWRADVPSNERNLDTTREFCKDLLNLTTTKFLSREEIDAEDNGQGLPVWDSRGGWWNRDGANVPYCRHIWKQMVVKKK